MSKQMTLAGKKMVDAQYIKKNVDNIYKETKQLRNVTAQAMLGAQSAKPEGYKNPLEFAKAIATHFNGGKEVKDEKTLYSVFRQVGLNYKEIRDEYLENEGEIELENITEITGQAMQRNATEQGQFYASHVDKDNLDDVVKAFGFDKYNGGKMKKSINNLYESISAYAFAGEKNFSKYASQLPLYKFDWEDKRKEKEAKKKKEKETKKGKK